MALLYAMEALAPRLGVAPAVAHLDHGLRGDASDGDARFVAEAARALGLPARIERRAVSLERRRGESLEMACRRVRYAFLTEAAAALGCASIATGHTADDQIETVLLRLFRGAGPRGLAGVPAEREAMTALPSLRIVRPMLGETRATVLAFLAERGVAYRVDASNGEPWAVRNRIRTEILPRIAADVNPAIVRTLARFAERQETIARYLEREAARLLSSLVVAEGAGYVAVDAAGLAGIDPALQPIMVRLAFEGVSVAAGLDPSRAGLLGEAHLSACVALASGSPEWRTRSLPYGFVARRIRDRIEFLAARGVPVGSGSSAGDGAAAPFCLPLDVPGCVAVPTHPSSAGPGALSALLMPAGTFPNGTPLNGTPPAGTLPDGTPLAGAPFDGMPPAESPPAETPPEEPTSGSGFGGPSPFAVEFDWRAICPPIEVRSRRPGDRIAPRGMAGRKTLQDLMVDRKVPREARDIVPVVADRDRVLWVVGLAASREAAVTSETREALLLTFEPSVSLRRDR